MRSQKKNNRSPRAFKNSAGERGWSGGRNAKGILPLTRNLFVKPKSNTPVPDAPPPKDANGTDATASADTGNE
jgi:hypothetical protein